MKSKELKTYNLPTDNVSSSQISAKPTWFFIILVIIGLLSFVFKFPAIYGVTLIVIGTVCICFMPRVTLIEFYNDYLVMHNRADKNTCVIIYYKEVESWYYSWSAKKDVLTIELVDGSSETIEGFSKTIFEAYMYKYLKDKHKKTK